MGAAVGPKKERRKKYGTELNTEWRGKEKKNPSGTLCLAFSNLC